MANARRKTLWCGNISEKVTEELLFELFIQAGPLEGVTIPKSKDGVQRAFAFITFKHEESVPYAKALMDGVVLCGRMLRLDNRSGEEPVENDTYLNVMFMHQRSISCPDRFSGNTLSNGIRNERMENNVHGRDFRESNTDNWRNEDTHRSRPDGRRSNWEVESTFSRNEFRRNMWNRPVWEETGFEQQYLPQNNFQQTSRQIGFDLRQQLAFQQGMSPGFQSNMPNFNPFQLNNPWGGYT